MLAVSIRIQRRQLAVGSRGPAGGWVKLGVLLIAMPVAVGCSSHRKGVLADLPAPVFGRGRAPRVAPVTPVLPRPATPKLPTELAVPSGWIPPGGIDDRWECIVIHHSATTSGDAARFDRAHKKRGWDGLGYDFVIGNGTDSGNGEVEVGFRWTQQRTGAHCKTAGNYHNEHGIGICLVGNFEQARPTMAQMESLARLVDFLTERCRIGPGRIFTHGGITHKTLCPGRQFELNKLNLLRHK